MRKSAILLFRSLVTIILVALFVHTGFAQLKSEAELTELLLNEGKLEPRDIADLENGKLIAKLLPSKDKREVAVFGITRFEGSVEDGIQAFNLTMERQKLKTAIKFGRFGKQPAVKDVAGLKLDKKEIRDLASCVVGGCKLRLSRAMIERIRNRFESNEGNSDPDIGALYRQVLVEYVSEYRNRGDDALITYDDKSPPLSLEAEMRALYSESTVLRKLAPEFLQYVEQFPSQSLENVEESISWSKVKVGLKPVILVTHAFRHKQTDETSRQVLVLSKQIYANHYFDSSLGLTSVLRIADKDKGSRSYIIYTNHSRSSTLRKGLGSIVRAVVKQEALEKLELILTSTRRYAESIAKNESVEKNVEEESDGFVARIFRIISPLWFLLITFIAIVLFVIFKNRS